MPAIMDIKSVRALKGFDLEHLKKANWDISNLSVQQTILNVNEKQIQENFPGATGEEATTIASDSLTLSESFLRHVTQEVETGFHPMAQHMALQDFLRCLSMVCKTQGDVSMLAAACQLGFDQCHARYVQLGVEQTMQVLFGYNPKSKPTSDPDA